MDDRNWVPDPFKGFERLLKAAPAAKTPAAPKAAAGPSAASTPAAGGGQGKRGLPDGTERNWGGVDYIKTGGKWIPKPKDKGAKKQDDPKGVKREVTPEGIKWSREIVPKELLPIVEKLFDAVRDEHLDKINAAVEAFATGNDSWGQHFKDGKLSDERKKLHKEIKDKYYDSATQAMPKDGQAKVVFMAGLPAAGKTTATQNLFTEVEGSEGRLLQDNDGEKYVVLNPDDFKAMMPEYDNGLAASFVHKESSKLNAAFVDKFSKMGVNVIMDGTLAKTDKAKEKLAAFKDLGYQSSLIHVDVPVETSLERARARYEKTGRFVPYDLIASYAQPIRTTTQEIWGDFDHAQILGG